MTDYEYFRGMLWALREAESWAGSYPPSKGAEWRSRCNSLRQEVRRRKKELTPLKTQRNLLGGGYHKTSSRLT